MTREEIIRMAREAGIGPVYGRESIERFANLVAAAEREACARMCDETRAARLAEQIRARGGNV